MLFGLLKKAEMPAAGTALPGRPEPIATAETNFVTGRPLKGPFPEGMAQAMFGMGCFWGVERKFWQLPGVWATAAGYAGGETPNPTYRVTARFVPYPEAKVAAMPNILGDLEPFTIVGTVSFTLGGMRHEMIAWRSGQRLWFVFRDLTSGRETYPASRFLYQPLPAAGEFELDFNYAQNPPCGYNPYTTCPLPPPQNRLNVRVEAGELWYEGRMPRQD